MQEISQENQMVLPALQSRMNADIAVGKDGTIRVFHDQALSDRLEYVEFNVQTGQLYFVLRWGKVQPFGEEIALKHCEYFKNTDNIYVIFGQDGKVMDVYEVPLLKQGAPLA